MERVFIGLGGNQGDVLGTLKAAIADISALPGVKVTGQSGFYQTPPWGGIEQPDYINAVVEMQVSVEPDALLQALLDIERRHGRNRRVEQQWGPRTLDCDILLFGERRLHSVSLSIPHPRMTQRAFVLVPLSEIDPEIAIPDFGLLATALQRLPPQPIRLIEER
jgi:2-amino-4-hydroxy-6-hydroxymethyldihydropteridine diphosphokinase